MSASNGTYTTFNIFLGVDDCETCGSNYNELNVAIQHGKRPHFDVSFRIGCFGGLSYDGYSRAQAFRALQQIADEWSHLFEGDLEKQLIYIMGKVQAGRFESEVDSAPAT